MSTISNKPNAVAVANAVLKNVYKNHHLTLDPLTATEAELADYLGKMKAISAEISKREKAVKDHVKKYYAPTSFETAVINGREYKINLSLYQKTKAKFFQAVKKFITAYRKAPDSQEVLSLKVAARRQ